jgi:enoyl-CoA hydratase/carnithine racemase
MAEQTIIYSKKDHIGWIKLNRPETGNKIDFSLARELTDVCARINGDQDVYAVFLSGAGPVFCSGGEITQDEQNTGMLVPSEAVASLERPVIALLNGDALGEGLELALACDIRLAADTARFGLPQITEGRIPVNGGTQRLSRVVGKGKALEMILTGETVNARDALEMGLVNKLLQPADLYLEGEKLAASLSAKAPFAMRYVKEAVVKGLDMPLDQGLRLEADLYFLLHTTADRTEGIRAFQQKRNARYEGK